MQDDSQPQKIPLIFYRTAAGSEPVKEWLKGLAEPERQEIGRDLMRAQWRWNVGMPQCRSLGNGLWEMDYGKSGQTCRRDGQHAYFCAFIGSI